MPPAKYVQPLNLMSGSNNDKTMSAKVYHPATNLMPLTPPAVTPSMTPSFSRPASISGGCWSRQNSKNT